MNNDELQKAIDDITRDNAASVPAEGGAADNEALAEEMASSAPVKGEGVALSPTAEIPAAPAPEVPVDPGMPPATPSMPPAQEAAPAAPVAPAPAPAPAPIPEAPIVQAPEAPVPEIAFNPSVTAEVAPQAGDMSEMLKEALRELYPLLDKVQMEPEEKFEICMKVAETDKNAIAGALNAAKQITNETTKAEALLEIVEAVK
ncbi:hypothetical protein IKF63_01740 [Candidatus Saccharibacteria bacterium]|nr:hypothetical protein [Candidatus Saccharibacteria bacterium]